jgi:hypothetical protein
MPYPPGYEDVTFAFGLAERAGTLCLGTAALVDAAAEERADAAAVARQEWRGPFRDDFDVGLAVLTAGADVLAAALRQFAGQLSDAAAAATVENERRAALRLEWDQVQLAAAAPQ